MSNDTISLIKLDNVHLYLDNKKKIIFFDIINSHYSKKNSIEILEYFKNFWILAKEQNQKYYLVIKINSIGIYPLSFYNNLVNTLNSLNDIFKEHLHSCSFLCNSSTSITILKPLFNFYKFVRPYKVCKTYEEVLIYFNKNENQIN